MVRCICLSYLIILSGCVVDGGHSDFNHHLKTKSLEKYAQDGIVATVLFPEQGEEDLEVRNRLVNEYLLIHSGALFVGEKLDQDIFRELFSKRNEENSSESLLLELPGLTMPAACVPISDDGYFLTAAHTLDYVNSHVVYATSDDTHTYVAAQQCRVVHSDHLTDLAIIKVDMQTPRYLRIRTEPLVKGDVLFGGNTWANECTAGKYVGMEHISRLVEPINQQIDADFYKTSMLTLSGDSGSPVIDTNGELCGIVSMGRDLQFMKIFKTQRSYIVPLDSNDIMRQIELDRADTSESE